LRLLYDPVYVSIPTQSNQKTDSGNQRVLSCNVGAVGIAEDVLRNMSHRDVENKQDLSDLVYN
jgi:hypothetical protein